jgi:rhamnose utilization protein RhaD (predicted bifunctional aldolase and dehydrogenase)/NAD(P)-dependent dehydrogenase (short-subunit alcohol dehydrogenase family)
VRKAKNMINRWNNSEAEAFKREFGPTFGEDLALRTYSSRLLGADPQLVIHGGGNSSVKTRWRDRFGELRDVIYVKASGYDMATIPPSGHSGLFLEPVRRLLTLLRLTAQEMVDELRRCLLDWRAATPSIETLMHAGLPERFVDHTHADAILTLTNQKDAEALVREVLGKSVLTIPYVKAGFELAQAVHARQAEIPESEAIVLMQHGLVTWGPTAATSYGKMIELVTRTEEYLESRKAKVFVSSGEEVEAARELYIQIAPVLRGSLARASGDPDRPFQRVILRTAIEPEILGFLKSECGRALSLTPVLTPDHLIRTKSLPLWLDPPAPSDFETFRERTKAAVKDYAEAYDSYFSRHESRLVPGLQKSDSDPRVVLIPGIGAVCAGDDLRAAEVARDITRQTLGAKTWFASTGSEYVGISEEHLFDMEYFPLQHAKLAASPPSAALGREVALITGAAGAIGLGVAEQLLVSGCHVALTDLAGENLESAVRALSDRFGKRVIGVPLDVTDEASVKKGFGSVIEEWGGVDLVIVNAGIAMVSSIAEMNLERFRRLERVNIEGTLLVLAEAGRHFKLQSTGGDIVVVSTKNVFAPGAKFGAYSATKAASHQLARIAVLEMADLGVRVNMISPDAVFSHGERKSGLWAEVGPDRMKARGLDEKGLEEYYRSRNLLKARVTAEHVGRAVLYFATRQTPTTGATIPVDGGLPDATPR